VPVPDPRARAEALYARYEALSDPPDLDTWLAEQPEVQEDPGLADRVRHLRDLDPRLTSLLPGPRSVRFYGRGESEPASPKEGPADLRPGKVLGDFELVRFIDQGGMGQVWEAEQKSLRRRVALKLVLPERVDTNSLELLAREARAGGRLHHRHIVETYAHGSDRQLAWIAQELVEGSWTLKDFLDELRTEDELPEGYYVAVAQAIAKLADALEASHRAGVIHRDVKPQNVLIAPDDEPKLTDFGLARITDETALSRTGDFAGTYFYMSPEQITANRIGIDHRTDVFSLGVVLYELLTLRRAFEGDTTQQVCSQVLFSDPPDPRKLRSQCPRDLAIICARAMEKSPGDRYATMAELAADLRRHLGNEPIVAQPPGPVIRGRKWMQRNPAKSVGLGIGSAALVVVSGLSLPEHRKTREELRSRALAPTEEERRADRETHPDYPELERLRGELAYRQRALAERRDGVETELPEVNGRAYPEKAASLSAAAWERVRPDRAAYGEEPLGVRLAERALDLAQPEERPSIRLVLARAYFAVGRDEDALGAASVAMDEASGAELARAEEGLLALEVAVEEATSEEALAEEAQRIGGLEERITELDERVNERRTWRFSPEEEEARWWNNQLTKLIGELEALESGLLAADAVSEEHGRSIPHRLAFARDLQAGFAEGGEYARAWAAALPAIREAYPSLELVPQMGLVPIGADPDSGLWEFWHVATGEDPARDPAGKLVRTEEMGLVLVLIPGGRFWMGAQSGDPDGRNHDPQAQGDEAPVHEVTLSGYFLSKYEMTQGQWKRFTGRNPSRDGPDGGWSPSWLASGGAASTLLPVEQVSWGDCLRELPRMGLSLPSEAQWEMGCRAGTETPWWSGEERESLKGVANLADAYARDHGGSSWTSIQEWLHDGATSHAPVGTYGANPYGLHEVHGNVWEWCLDGYDPGFYGRGSEIDPVAPWEGAATHVARGGAFPDAAAAARSAERIGGTPSKADADLGLRPARAVSE